jgi:hypothetical protein
MKFATATKPEPLKQRSLRFISYGLGFWVAALAILQMVSFEKFVDALRSYHVTGERGTLVVAIVLLFIEIFAVPFLLRMTLSPAARAVSAMLALATPYAWSLLMVLAFTTGQTVDNAGYFGGFLAVPLGTGLVLTVNLVWMTLVTIGFSQLGGGKAVRALTVRG